MELHNRDILKKGIFTVVFPMLLLSVATVRIVYDPQSNSGGRCDLSSSRVTQAGKITH